ncbi:MAG TPA: hypothetical protein PKH23_00620 [Bacillota bacterium]|nr:hypothetical protein [Bacillota bacterium]
MKLIVKSLICLFVTTLYTFVNVLLVFKSGMSISASLITPLLYYFLFGSGAMPAPASMAWASQAKGFIHLSEADHTNLLIVALSVLVASDWDSFVSPLRRSRRGSYCLPRQRPFCFSAARRAFYGENTATTENARRFLPV